MTQLNQLQPFQGQTVYDQQGEKIGKFDTIYADIDTGEAEWIGVDSGGLFGSKRVLVPAEGYQRREDGIAIPYSKDRVKDAPKVEEEEISPEREAEIYEYYGLRRAGLERPTETYDPSRASPATSDRDSMTRSEEQMRVGKRESAVGHARLRKWVETEPVSEQVKLREEHAYVEREPINEPTQGRLGEDEVDVSLRREEPVVEKRTVAKERVSLGKDVDERTETVQEELSRERIEAEGDIEERRGR